MKNVVNRFPHPHSTRPNPHAIVGVGVGGLVGEVAVRGKNYENYFKSFKAPIPFSCDPVGR